MNLGGGDQDKMERWYRKADETRDKREAVGEGERVVSARGRELKPLVTTEDGGRRASLGRQVGQGFSAGVTGTGQPKGSERHAALWSRDAQIAAGFCTAIADYRREVFENSREDRCRRWWTGSQQRSRDSDWMVIYPPARAAPTAWSRHETVEPPRDLRLRRARPPLACASAELRNATLHSSAQAGLWRPTRGRQPPHVRVRGLWSQPPRAVSRVLTVAFLHKQDERPVISPGGARRWCPLGCSSLSRNRITSRWGLRSPAAESVVD